MVIGVSWEEVEPGEPGWEALPGRWGPNVARGLSARRPALRSTPVSQAASQAAAFYGDVAKSRIVWTLRDKDGYPAPKSRNGVRAQPFWSSRSRAEKMVSTVPAYSGFDVIEIPLDKFMDDWLPGAEADGLRIGVNWSGPRATGYDIEPRSVRAALDAVLDT